MKRSQGYTVRTCTSPCDVPASGRSLGAKRSAHDAAFESEPAKPTPCLQCPGIGGWRWATSERPAIPLFIRGVTQGTGNTVFGGVLASCLMPEHAFLIGALATQHLLVTSPSVGVFRCHSLGRNQIGIAVQRIGSFPRNGGGCLALRGDTATQWVCGVVWRCAHRVIACWLHVSLCRAKAGTLSPPVPGGYVRALCTRQAASGRISTSPSTMCRAIRGHFAELPSLLPISRPTPQITNDK